MGTCRNQKPLLAIFNQMVPTTLYPKAFYFLVSCSCVCRFWSKLPLWGDPHPERKTDKACLETTAYSGRIFQKSSSGSPRTGGPFCPENQFQRRGEQTPQPSPPPGFSTCPGKPSSLASSQPPAPGQFSCGLINRESSVYISPLTLKHLSSLLIHGFVWPPKWFLAAGEKQKSVWKSK